MNLERRVLECGKKNRLAPIFTTLAGREVYPDEAKRISGTPALGTKAR